MKVAGVYFFNDNFFVTARAQTVDGLWIGWEPKLKVDGSSSATALGQAVVTALDGSEVDVPHPTDWKSGSSSFLKFVGARSLKAFYKTAMHVELEEDAGGLTLTPYVKSTESRGLDPDDSRKMVASRDDIALLGTKLRELFDTTA